MRRGVSRVKEEDKIKIMVETRRACHGGGAVIGR